MNAYDTLATDYAFWDGVESITYRGSLVREIAYAKRTDTTRGRVPIASESIIGDSVDWHLPDSLLAGVEPRLGDRLYVGMDADVDSTTEVWIVDKAKLVRYGTEWILTSTRFGPDFLRHTLDINGPTVTKDAATGAAKETFGVISAGVPCWVRPADAQESTAWFQDGSFKRLIVYFNADPGVDSRNTFLFDGDILSVVGSARDIDGLGIVWTVPCIL